MPYPEKKYNDVPTSGPRPGNGQDPAGLTSGPHLRDVEDGIPYGMIRENNAESMRKRWFFEPAAAARLRAASRRALGKSIK